MAGSVNKAIVIGNVTGAVEVRSFQNGGRVANFSVATSEKWKSKQTGQAEERTQYHRVSILNEPLIAIAEKYLKKGSKVYLEGQIETRKYTDKEGQERFSTEIVLRPYRGEITILDSAKQDKPAPAPTTNSPPDANPPILDDSEIPF